MLAYLHGLRVLHTVSVNSRKETPLAADCSAVTSRMYTYVFTAHAQCDVRYIYNTHAHLNGIL